MCNHSYVMRFYVSPVHGVHGGFTRGGIFGIYGFFYMLAVLPFWFFPALLLFLLLLREVFSTYSVWRSMQCLYYYTDLYYLFL